MDITETQEETWEQRYRKSKPLISYSLLLGARIDEVMEIIGEVILQKNNLDDYKISPIVLSRMPEVDRHDYEFPEGIADFVFYDGFHIIKGGMGNYEFVPLVLTSVESKRKFGMALKFTEHISNYLCVFKRMLEGTNPHNSKEQIIKLNSLCKMTPRVEYTKRIVEFLNKFTLDELRDQSETFLDENYYVPKAFLIISESPYFTEYKEILDQLYKMCKREIAYPYEYYLRYITYEVPKPGRGLNVEFVEPSGRNKIVLVNSKRSELPTVQDNFYWDVFMSGQYPTFDDNFLTILYWFLWQVGTTVLISSDPIKLVTMAETLRTIIFPFEYDDSYMPLIYKTNYDYLSAPFPVMIGALARDDDLKDIERHASEKSLLVELDTDTLRVKYYNDFYTVKEFKKEYDEEGKKEFSLKNFPSKPLKILKKQIKETKKSTAKLINPDQEIEQDFKCQFVKNVREIFLNFFAVMFKDYESWIKNEVNKKKGEESNEDLPSVFDQQLFIKKNRDKYDFYEDLFNTRAWILFLETKFYAPTQEKEDQIEFFDEFIRQNYKRSSKSGKKDKGKPEEEGKSSEKKSEKERNLQKFGGSEYIEYLNKNDWSNVKYMNYVDLIGNRSSQIFVYMVIPHFSIESIPNERNFDRDRIAGNLWDKDEKITVKADKIREIMDQIQTTTNDQHVIMSWILLWCLWFKYLQSIEKKVRLYELTIVLEKLFKEKNYDKSNIIFFEYILQTIFDHGKRQHMDDLFKTINEWRIPSNLKMKQYYFKCIDKDQNMRQDNKKKNKKIEGDQEEGKAPESLKEERKREEKLINNIRKSKFQLIYQFRAEKKNFEIL
jgi:hypothetical protein